MKCKHLVLPVIMVMMFLPLAVAEPNNPGHDTLYIEQQGDSEVNGSFNISYNTILKGKSMLQSYLDLYANGSLPTPTYSQIAGSSSALYIDSPGPLYINTIGGGGTSMVYLGTTGDTVSLNVTSNLYVLGSTATVNGKNICLADGTNCISGPNSGNVTSVNVTGGTPLTINSTTGNIRINITIPTCSGTDKLSYNGAAFSCESDETGAGGDGTGGWTNNSQNTTTSLNVGIGTTSPSEKLTVAGNISMTSGGFIFGDGSSPSLMLSNANGAYIKYGNAGFYAGSGPAWINADSYIMFKTNNDVEQVRITNTGLFGIGTASPTQKLDVNGSMNISGNISINSNKICHNANCSIYTYFNGTCTIDQGLTSRRELC